MFVSNLFPKITKTVKSNKQRHVFSVIKVLKQRSSQKHLPQTVKTISAILCVGLIYLGFIKSI